MAVFNADPELLMAGGKKINDTASDFGAKREDIYNKIESLFAKGYTSPDGIVLKEKLREYEPLLKDMQGRMDNYGNFFCGTSNTVTGTQDELSDAQRNGGVN